MKANQTKTLFFSLSAVLLLAATWQYLAWSGNPRRSAVQLSEYFLDQLKDGNCVKTISCLGSEGCACEPPGGWRAYLTYGSGLEPNIAFLLGSNFKHERAEVGLEFDDLTHKNVRHQIIREHISFRPGSEPFLLPVKLAFGSNMSLEELDSYCSNPQSEGLKGLTLRLRTKLVSGAIKAPPELFTAPVINAGEKQGKLSPDELTSMFGSDAAYLLFPKDVAGVHREDGSPVTIEELKSHLPRLKHITLSLDIVKKSTKDVRKVWKCIVENPQLVLPGGRQVALRQNDDGRVM